MSSRPEIFALTLDESGLTGAWVRRAPRRLGPRGRRHAARQALALIGSQLPSGDSTSLVTKH